MIKRLQLALCVVLYYAVALWDGNRRLSEDYEALRAEAVGLVEAISNDKLLFPPEGELARNILEFISTHKAF